jgi:hypothetical protein
VSVASPRAHEQKIQSCSVKLPTAWQAGQCMLEAGQDWIEAGQDMLEAGQDWIEGGQGWIEGGHGWTRLAKACTCRYVMYSLAANCQTLSVGPKCARGCGGGRSTRCQTRLSPDATASAPSTPCCPRARLKASRTPSRDRGTHRTSSLPFLVLQLGDQGCGSVSRPVCDSAVLWVDQPRTPRVQLSKQNDHDSWPRRRC